MLPGSPIAVVAALLSIAMGVEGGSIGLVAYAGFILLVATALELLTWRNQTNA